MIAGRPLRERNAAGTRQAILDAARAAFAIHGIDGVGMRDIARAADVNAALVHRYFGTKQLLFAEVMESSLGFEGLSSDGDGLIRFLVDRVLKPGAANSFDPILALLRSASTPDAQPILREYLAREAFEPLALMLEGQENPREKANMVVAFLLGLMILRSILESEPSLSMQPAQIAWVFQRVFTIL